MTDALTIFGKPFSSGHHGHVRHGILKLSINGEYGPDWTTTWRASVSIAGETLSESEPMHYNAQACSWLESEARRIMRECFEIAGPVHVELDANGKFSDGPFQAHTFARFRDG